MKCGKTVFYSAQGYISWFWFRLSVSQSYVVAFVAVIKITGPPPLNLSASATDIASGAPDLLSFLDRASVVVEERVHAG